MTNHRHGMIKDVLHFFELFALALSVFIHELVTVFSPLGQDFGLALSDYQGPERLPQANPSRLRGRRRAAADVQH